MENTALELEERKQLNDFVSEVSERLTLRTKLLEENLAVIGKWPDENFFVKKDSTLKKNTAFVKKIRNFLDSQKEPLLVEFDMLNLSKYVEEVATAIVEAKIKTTDIPFILKLCSAMYQRYADFGSLFLDAWKKVFSAYKDMKHANMSKFRVDLALFADLNTIGIFRESEGVRLLAGQLTTLTNGDLETFSNVGILCSFCRHCSDDWIGLIPRRIRILSEKYHIGVPRSKFLPTERQAKCRTLFQEYLANAQCYLQNIVKNACRLVSANRKQMENRGEVSEERKEHADQLLLNCRKLHESLCTLVDLLDSDPLPDFASMIKEVSVTDDANITEHDQVNHCCVLSMITPQSDQETSSQLFEDEETRLFYESLPDIKAMVPGILYKESEQVKLDVSRDKSEETESAETEDIDVETLESELAKEEALFKAADDASFGDAESVHLAERDKLPSALRVDDAAEDPSSSGKVLMETFLTQLPNCVNRDLIDRAAIDFCLNLNKRSNRRRLARALLMVPRTRYDLLPFYARLVAALAPVMPDLVMDVNAMLTGEFRWRVSKRDQLNLESKLKIVRFIGVAYCYTDLRVCPPNDIFTAEQLYAFIEGLKGELVKFRIFPAHQALSCLKLLLPQFVHHNIEMACALLDTCGRFLYRLPVSHQRTKVYLEVMIRKKTALHMDQRYTIMIENTYYYCNPPPSTRQIAKAVELTPEMQYIRRLLLRDLDRVSVNNVLRSIRKINWEDPEVSATSVYLQCLTKIRGFCAPLLISSGTP
ncbi:regulator of nonsense transcripts 2, partial [Paragonimus westermani]